MNGTNSGKSEWSNQYIEKYRVLWTDPWRSNESSLLYYCLALPVAHICDIFRYRIFNKNVLKEKKRPRYQGFRLQIEKDDNLWWVPGTNLRILADYKFVLSWTFILIVLTIFLFGLLILINSIAE